MLFIYYPRCGTCRKAKAWLDEHELTYQERHIVNEPPTARELTEWVARSGLEWTKFMNTSGRAYREMGLAEKRASMSPEELAEILASDGMLVKRPILVLDDGRVLTGFREGEWKQALLGEGAAV